MDEEEIPASKADIGRILDKFQDIASGIEGKVMGKVNENREDIKEIRKEVRDGNREIRKEMAQKPPRLLHGRSRNCLQETEN